MLIYLASPYSTMDPALREQRVNQTMHATSVLMSMRVSVFSPIVHCHELALRYNLPTDVDYWLDYNREFILRSSYMFVLQLPGWGTSRGIQMEVDICKKANIPVMDFKYYPETTKLDSEFRAVINQLRK